MTKVKRILEVAFRHKILLLAPLLAALIGTAAYVYLLPASYQSSATLWVNGGGVGTQSPAQTQADIANEYLKTDTFALAVSTKGPLGEYLNTHADATQGFSLKSLMSDGGPTQKPSTEAIRQYLAAHVTITTLGPAELIVTVNGPSPDVAKGTANALIAQLLESEVAAKTTAAKTQLGIYQTQLQDQAAVITKDLAAITAYLAAHPNLVGPKNAEAAATDPQLALLQDQAAVARQAYVGLLTKIDQTTSDIALAEQPTLAPFRVVDAPQTPSLPAFGKQQLIAIAAGLLAGFLAMAGMAALLYRLDTTIHTADDVQPMLGLPVIGSTPLSARA